MNWESILKEIGVVGVLAGLLTWLIKQLGQNFIDKNLKAYEKKLDHQSELFKQELSFLSQKANRLHDKRIERIEEIYALLTDFHNDMQQLISWKIVTGMAKEEIEQQEIDNVNKANESGTKFLAYYTRNKLYFNDETCKLIEDIIKHLKGSHTDFTFKYIFQNIPAEMHYENVKNATEKIRETVPAIKVQLEANFRKIIGVD